MDPPQGHYTYGMYYWLTEQDIGKATKELKKALEFTIDDDELLLEIRMTSIRMANQWGYKYLSEKDFKKSYSYFAWAIRIAPERANPYDSMGDHYTAIAKPDSALWYYEKALTIDPAFNASLFNKAATLERLGQEDQAIKIYEQIINDSPSDRYAKSAKERLAKVRENK